MLLTVGIMYSICHIIEAMEHISKYLHYSNTANILNFLQKNNSYLHITINNFDRTHPRNVFSRYIRNKMMEHIFKLTSNSRVYSTLIIQPETLRSLNN